MKKSTMSLLAALLLAGGTATANVQLQNDYIGGSSEEWIAGFMRELGKEPSTIDEANLVTLRECWIAPVWDYFGMYGFGDSSQKTLIQLPANLTGIGSLESGKNEPARYFNLQGIEVTRPAAGEVVIEKRGDATRKVIVR